MLLVVSRPHTRACMKLNTSAGAVELRTSLSTRFGAELPTTVTFDYPTVATLASFLAGTESVIAFYSCQNDDAG